MITEAHLQAVRQVLSAEPQRDPFRRFSILAMQMADVGRCIEYMKAYPKDEKEPARGYRAELKAGLGDLLAQTITLCVLYEIDPNEVLNLGIVRLSEFKKKTGFRE